MKSAPRDFRSDAGAALITVLVMLSIMAAVAILVVDAARSSMLRTSNQEQMEQTRWYFLTAESYAANKIAILASPGAANLLDQEAWQGREFTYPVDDGAMTLRIRDGSNCFNLNSLVERRENGMLVSSARGQAQFGRLLDLLDVRANAGLAASLADWIDSDEESSQGGAEDAAYSDTDTKYRTANTLLADISELRSVRGFTEETVQAIEPFVCVRPTETPNVLNINTLLSEQAPLLATLFPDLPLSTARELILSRPRGGWTHVDALLSDPRTASVETSSAARVQLGVQSRYYVLATRVERAGIGENSLALIEASARAKVLRRIFGASEHLM